MTDLMDLGLALVGFALVAIAVGEFLGRWDQARPQVGAYGVLTWRRATDDATHQPTRRVLPAALRCDGLR